MLSIDNLHAQVEGKGILNGINLDIKPGEVHAIMGPNGSGKSTLSTVVAGHEDYEVTKGSLLYQGADISDLSADERAHLGIFLYISLKRKELKNQFKSFISQQGLIKT